MGKNNYVSFGGQNRKKYFFWGVLVFFFFLGEKGLYFEKNGGESIFFLSQTPIYKGEGGGGDPKHSPALIIIVQ